jgi:hypothetical protein
LYQGVAAKKSLNDSLTLLQENWLKVEQNKQAENEKNKKIK